MISLIGPVNLDQYFDTLIVTNRESITDDHRQYCKQFYDFVVSIDRNLIFNLWRVYCGGLSCCDFRTDDHVVSFDCCDGYFEIDMVEYKYSDLDRAKHAVIQRLMAILQ